jgi:hypothetical protein
MYKENLDILQEFKQIDLVTANTVKLFRRIDLKFIFNKIYLSDLLSVLSKQFHLLQVDGIVEQKYESVYFDTPNFASYLAHHRGELPRDKYRIRKYLDSNSQFAENKTRNNKDVTFKKRKEIKGAFDEKQFESLIDGDLTLEEKLTVKYTRIALINLNTQERISIDYAIEASNEGLVKELGDLCIVELKQESLNLSKALGLLKGLAFLNYTSISKYCYACNLIFPELKANLFKERNRVINHIVFGMDEIRNASNF